MFSRNDQLDFGTSPQHYYDIEPSLSKELLKQTAPYLTSIKGLWCKPHRGGAGKYNPLTVTSYWAYIASFANSSQWSEKSWINRTKDPILKKILWYTKTLILNEFFLCTFSIKELTNYHKLWFSIIFFLRIVFEISNFLPMHVNC